MSTAPKHQGPAGPGQQEGRAHSHRESRIGPGAVRPSPPPSCWGLCTHPHTSQERGFVAGHPESGEQAKTRARPLLHPPYNGPPPSILLPPPKASWAPRHASLGTLREGRDGRCPQPFQADLQPSAPGRTSWPSSPCRLGLNFMAQQNSWVAWRSPWSQGSSGHETQLFSQGPFILKGCGVSASKSPSSEPSCSSTGWTRGLAHWVMQLSRHSWAPPHPPRSWARGHMGAHTQGRLWAGLGERVEPGPGAPGLGTCSSSGEQKG